MIEVDAKDVLNLFSELNSRQQKQAVRNALRRSANIVVKEAKKNLKSHLGYVVNHRNRWNGKTLQSGIKATIKKNLDQITIHIMGDFRLKFFEKGTKVRKLKKNGANRGKIQALFFFKDAKINKEKEVISTMDRMFQESVQKIYNKHRK